VNTSKAAICFNNISDRHFGVSQIQFIYDSSAAFPSSRSFLVTNKLTSAIKQNYCGVVDFA